MKKLLLLSIALFVLTTGCSKKYLSGDIVETYRIDENYDKVQVKMKGPRKKYRNRKISKTKATKAKGNVTIKSKREVKDKYIILRRNTPGIIKSIEQDSISGASTIWVDFGLETPFAFVSLAGEKYTLVTDTLQESSLMYESKPADNNKRKLALKARIKDRKKYRKDTKRIKGVKLK